MVMGGSGGRFAAALSRQGETIGAEVFRLSPKNLKDRRGDASKDDDHVLLAQLLRADRGNGRSVFHKMLRRDRDVIRVAEAFQLRQDAMKARIACGQQLDTRFVGMVFLSEEGLYPEGRIENEADRVKASDAIYMSLLAAEAARKKDLYRAVQDLDVYQHIFSHVPGCGPRIAAGLVAAIGTIARFEVEPDPQKMEESWERSRHFEQVGRLAEDLDKVSPPHGANRYQITQLVRNWKRRHGQEVEAIALEEVLKEHNVRHRLRQKAVERGAYRLRAFCGVHVLQGGKYTDVPPEKQFPRKRAGMVANWNTRAREALYQLADQFNRRPGSEWGNKLLTNKDGFRQRHPDVVIVTSGDNGQGKKRYTKGHIHKMGQWRSLSQFVSWLYPRWLQLEKRQRQAALNATPANQPS